MQGNHGEDVKELYYYLDNTPTHAYMKALYKYPQKEYPYSRLEKENWRAGQHRPEVELMDLGRCQVDYFRTCSTFYDILNLTKLLFSQTFIYE